MDWIIWLVVIVAIVAIVWWLLNRNSSRGSSGTTATGTTRTTGNGATDKSAPPHVHDAGQEAGHRGALSGGGAAASASAAAVTGMPAAAGFSHAAPEPEPEPDRTAATADAADSQAQLPDSAASGATGNTLSPAASDDAPSAPAPSRGADTALAGGNPEWETQWSETPPAEAHGALHSEPGHGGAHGDHAKEDFIPAAGSATAPVHHPEYTEPHAPTLPGAESAAAEAEVVIEGGPTIRTGFDGRAGDGLTTMPPTSQESPQQQHTLPSPELADSSLAAAETRQTTTSSAASETAVAHTAEPAGHLAVDQPYGEGSAAPAADGSGPEGFTVKGNASSMIYHDETSPSFEETIAEVWFLSAAHAEAAGFRPPRRSRQ